MKKRVIIGIVIIVLIIALSIFGIYKYQVNKKIKEINVGDYEVFECIVECPTYENEHGTQIDNECSDDCAKYQISSRKIRVKYREKLLENSEELTSCYEFLSSGEKDKTQACIKDILPTLREKYISS